ncbi:MAG: cysteine desulfurase [Armatimonadetes bacterium]|nr:cysteine desulfurase [Armatimonadota bacterium]
MNVYHLLNDFPILQREINGKRIVYLDSAATSQKPRQVIQALVDYYEGYNANVHRAVYKIGEEATQAYEGVRQKVADFIGAKDTGSIIFTRNATEAINLVAYSWGRENVGEGDEIVLTPMEHHSNLVPWQLLAAERGATLKFIEMNADGTLDLGGLDSTITERTKLVSVTHMSNVLGTINPIRQIADAAHAVGAVMVTDAAQSAPHLALDVEALGADFVAFSSHKMLGPTGVGVLYGRRDLLEAMPPFIGGGDMIKQVWLDRAKWNDLPWKFEAGTPNIADVIGFGAALDYLNGIGMEVVRRHEIEITEYALRKLREVEGLTMYGPANVENRGGLVSFNIEDVHPHDLATLLDRDNVCVRAGHHCCHPLMRMMEVSATARASFYLYNTPEDVDALAESILRAREVFARVAV